MRRRMMRATTLAAALLLLLTCERDAPQEPSLEVDGPGKGDVGKAYKFTATATDPQSDSISIRFIWAEGDTSDWSNLVAGGEPVTREHAWAKRGTYLVTPQARNQAGTSIPAQAGTQLVTVGGIGSVRGSHANGFTWYCSPAVGLDGTVYIGRVLGGIGLIALYPDASYKWSISTRVCFYETPAIGPDGTVYYGPDEEGAGEFYAVNPDGSMKQRLQVAKTNSWARCPAFGPDGTIYVIAEWAESPGVRLIALDPDGTEKWTFGADALYASPPVVGPEGVIFFSCEGVDTGAGVYAVEPNGELKWFAADRYAGTAPLAIGADGTIYSVGGSEVLEARSPEGRLLWSYTPQPEGSEYFGCGSSPVIGPDGTIYIVGLKHSLYAVNPDGTHRWRYVTGFWASRDPLSIPAVGCDRVVYVASGDSTGLGIDAVNPDGTQRWRCILGGNAALTTALAIGADSTIYACSEDSIYAVGCEGPCSDAPWPMFAHDAQHSGYTGRFR